METDRREIKKKEQAEGEETGKPVSPLAVAIQYLLFFFWWGGFMRRVGETEKKTLRGQKE
jgi:hypothetical protein